MSVVDLSQKRNKKLEKKILSYLKRNHPKGLDPITLSKEMKIPVMKLERVLRQATTKDGRILYAPSFGWVGLNWEKIRKMEKNK